MDRSASLRVRKGGKIFSKTEQEIEEWLDFHQDWFEEYFLRKGGSSTLVHRWNDAVKADSLFPRKRVTSDQNDRQEESIRSANARPRSGSRQYLRQDFAKARSKTVFHTWAPSTSDTEDGYTDDSDRPVSPRELSVEGRNSRKHFRRASTVPPPSPGMTLSALLEPQVQLPHKTYITHETKMFLRSTNERDFFLAIVKDISHDLDLTSLCDKIEKNVNILVDAERTAVLLLEGPKGKEQLVHKSRSVDSQGGSSSDSERGPVISPIVGNFAQVIETGKALRLHGQLEELAQQEELEQLLGCPIGSLLLLPVTNSENDILGVAVVVNKTNGTMFTKDNEKLLVTYLTFCGIGITNAQVFDNYRKEYDRNRKLLEVTHHLFEEQTSLDNVVQKIMQRAQSLLKCERCSVLLVKEQGSDKVTFSKVFDMTNSICNGHSNAICYTGDAKLTNGIVEHVAMTGENVNVTDAETDTRFNIDRTSGFRTKSILCLPIRDNNTKIIGVAQILNRADGFPFDEHDERLFEAFTLFCGLGINNTLMFNEVSKAMATQKVALEVLSYHASATQQEVESLKSAKVPDKRSLRISRFDFDDFSLKSDEMTKASLRIFLDMGLIQRFKMDYEVLCRWLLTVRKNYRPVAYHNYRHAFNVMQVMYTVLQTANLVLTDLEKLSLLVACLCHDLDHRGTNNAFQEKSQSPLAKLYGSKATMEYHHFNHAVVILSSQGHNIFSSLSSQEYSEVMNILKHAILSTDLTTHFKVRDQFFKLVDSKADWIISQNRELLRSMLMTACDVAASTKTWKTQQKIAELVTSEFFDQGDKERKELNIEPAVSTVVNTYMLYK
ncbi:dual 3',5'-cyclic-AMP and -GMP phosphodiesterase 11A-like [Anneissia japonica]|uniref:dual 3',5'-cyclic-AMP and -GMP phosphodiesterase 11A-like n=1 Tax=Anneissia japonica TaxID=1529436 RepID=UPI001425A841|nr:dual 3',5'-cyclic-AMP and -GMP phosphodiesterase 11A-like [Anneissia japonica]